MSSSYPAERRFVGRDAELAELGALLQGAAEGTTVPVLVEGDAGIGKSAMLAELARRAAVEGWQVARGAAWDEPDAPPYWPWTQVARELQGLTRGTDLARVLLDDPADAEHIERFELFDAAADLVTSAARTRPVLILLDDLHAADVATSALTRFVARQLGERPVLLVASYRPSDLERRPEVRAHVDELSAGGVVVRLGQLGVDEVAELLAGLELPVDAHDVHAVTGGNPLFVEQLVRSGLSGVSEPAGSESGAELPFGPLAGVVADPAAVGAGDALRSAIAGRIAELPVSRQTALAAIAVVGHEFGVDELEELVAVADSPSFSRVRHDVEQLISVGLVQRVDDESGPVEIVHSLIAEAAEAALDPAVSERLHGRAAVLIGDDPDRSGERAHHLLRAGIGMRDEAVKASVLAAEHASAVSAHEEAVEHYERALDALDLLDLGVPDGGPLGLDRARDRRRLDVLLALGRSQRLAGRPDDADLSFDRAAELADRLDDPEASASAALRGGVQLFFRSELEAARTDRMRAALASLPDGDGSLRARLLGELAAIDGAGPAAIAQAADAVAMARRVGEPVTLGYALAAQQTTDLGPGTLTKRLASAREILVIARQVGDPGLATQGRYLLFGAALEHGDLRGVEVGGSIDGAGALVEWSHARVAHWAACTHALLDGRAADAEAIAERGLACGMETGDSFALRVYGAQIGVIRRLQGRFGEMEAIYEAQWRANPDELMWPAALASIWAVAGRREEARAALDAIGSVERIAGGLHWLVTAALAAEAAAIVGHDDLGAELWERLLPFADRMVPLNLGAAVVGPVGAPLGALGLRLGHVDEGIAHLERAVRVCARVRARWWLVESQLALTQALIDHRAEAGDASRRSVELLDEAVVTARRYGFDRLLESAEVLRDRLRSTSSTVPAPTASSSLAPPVSVAPSTSASMSQPTSSAGAATGHARPSVSVLGSFEVASADGRVASWSSRKARELLKILVAKRGAPVHREVLMDLLWPGEDPSTVGNRLSVALWTVRRSLDPDRRAGTNEFVAADRQTVRLRVQGVEIDAERFLDSAQSAIAARAAQVARSPGGGRAAEPDGPGASDEAGGAQEMFDRLMGAAMLHPGPALPDEPYAEWASGLQREVHLAHTRVLAALAEMAVERGDDLTAADAFRGLVESDPYDRTTHEGLVAALERIGAAAMAEVERRRYGSVASDD